MTYNLVNLPFLLIAALVFVIAFVARRGPRWRGLGVSAIVTLVLTAIFDNVLVGIGIVGYDASLVSGVRIGVAPIEDFAYAVAGLLLLPALWSLLAPRESRFARSGRVTPREPGPNGRIDPEDRP